MDSCQTCGAALAAAVEWCGQCFAPRGGAVLAPTRPLPATGTLKPTLPRSRWRKTTTTFGPVGRLVATVGLVVPLIFFVVIAIFTGGLTIVGVGIWGFVIMPWGLRDVWKAGQLPAA